MLNVLSNATTYKANQCADGAFKRLGDGSKILTDLAKESFGNFVRSYVHNIAFPFKRILTKVYFVFDTPNWRKVYINWYFQQECNAGKEAFVYKYKTPTDDGKERRENLFLYINYFFDKVAPEIFAVDGIQAIRANGAEGDDAIAYLYENVTDEDIAIWSVDTDLVQFVEKSNRNVFLMTPKVSNVNRKLYICDAQVKRTAEKVDLLSITAPRIDTMAIIDYLVKSKGYKLEVVNPIKSTFVKILSGDKQSDNIPSVHTWPSGTRTMSLTEKVALEIYDELVKEYPDNQILAKIDEYNRVFFERIIQLIADKYKPGKSGKKANTIDPDDSKKTLLLMDNLVLNTKLIRLNKANIPDVIYSRIDESFKAGNDKKFSYEKLNEIANKYKVEEDQFKL